MVQNPYDLVKGDTQLSSLPLILVQLNEVINNPYSSIVDIGKIISEDQGLTARLLRLANSPFYSYPSKVETITQAITIIGTQQVLDLVLATSVMQQFKGIPGAVITMESFWHHSIACGTTARILAVYQREVNAERFFVAGILHDIGRLIMCTKIPETAREMLTRCHNSGELVHKVEKEVLGFDHADVGEVLLKEWKLPPSLVEMVASHHKPLRSKHFAAETSVVHVADIIAHALQLGSSGEPLVPPLDANAWERIEVAPGMLSSALDETERQFAVALQLMYHKEQKK